MNDNEMKLFEISFNKEQECYNTVEILTRLMCCNGDQENFIDTAESVKINAETQGILSFDSQIKNNTIVIQSHVVTGLFSHKDFKRIIRDPLKVCIYARPPAVVDGSKSRTQQEIEGSFYIKVRGSQFLKLSVKNQEYVSESGDITIPLDGKSTFTLIASGKEYFPSTQKVVDVSKHYKFQYSLILPAEMKNKEILTFEPVEPNSATGNLSKESQTIWKTSFISRDYQPDQIEAFIEVKAALKSASGTGPDNSEDILQERIKILLVPGEIAIKVTPVGVERPIQALSSAPVEMELHATNIENGEPVGNRALSWTRVNEGALKGGKLSHQEGITGESDGKVKFQYTPPDLFYSSGTVASEEDIAVFDGTGHTRKEVAKFKIRLLPRILMRISAEKKGLSFKKVEADLTSEMEQDKGIITGRLILEDKINETGKTVKLPVAHAKIALYSWDGMNYVSLLKNIKTDCDGKFTCILRKGESPPGKMETGFQLDYSRGQVPIAQLNELLERRISEYEASLELHSPLYLFSYSLLRKLKSYRQVLCSQLAGSGQEHYDSILSSLELISIGLKYTTSFERAYHAHSQRHFTMLELFIRMVSELSATAQDITGKIGVHWKSSYKNLQVNYDAALWTSFLEKLIAQGIVPELKSLVNTMETFLPKVTEEAPEEFKTIVADLSKSLKECMKDTLEVETIIQRMAKTPETEMELEKATLCGLLMEAVKTLSDVMSISLFMVSLLSLVKMAGEFKGMSGHIDNGLPEPGVKNYHLIKNHLLNSDETTDESKDVPASYEEYFECYVHRILKSTGTELTEVLRRMRENKASTSEWPVMEMIKIFDTFDSVSDSLLMLIYNKAKNLRAHTLDGEAQQLLVALPAMLSSFHQKTENITVTNSASMMYFSTFTGFLERYVALLARVKLVAGSDFLDDPVTKLGNLTRAFKMYGVMVPQLASDIAASGYHSLVFIEAISLILSGENSS